MKFAHDFQNRDYRHIFVDFDSTLYLWDQIEERRNIPSDMDIEWMAQCLSAEGRPYNRDQLNSLLIDYLETQVCEIHLLTHVEFSFEAFSKFNFVNSVRPGLLTDWIGVAGPESKSRVMQIFESLGCPKESMLIIDDNYDVVCSCRDAGYDVAEPQFIMELMAGRTYEGDDAWEI